MGVVHTLVTVSLLEGSSQLRKKAGEDPDCEEEEEASSLGLKMAVG